ncbi:MAG: hypothetical protein ACOYEW_16905 [Anaerolineae bacterium]|jgi:hypothetical protein
MPPSRVILDGVDRYRVSEAMFEGLRVVLSYLGEPYSPAYIQGISGAAFVIAGPCPCAPTCGHDIGPAALARLLGFQVEELPLFGDGVDGTALLPAVIARVKDELRSGRPVLVWNAFTLAEWDVVCGFDESDGSFLGRGSYAGWDDYARAPQDRMLTGCDGYPALGAIILGEKTGTFDPRATELDALQRAVQHARTPEDRLPEADCASGQVGEWRFRKGLGCYDWWIGSLRSEPARPPNLGDWYCLGIYRSAHRAASAFLREIEPWHPGASANLLRAAEAFQAEADALDRCAARLFPDGRLRPESDATANRAAADLLTEAREAYATGIAQIEAALAAAGAS